MEEKALNKTKMRKLEWFLKQNEDVLKILKRAGDLQMPNWYLGAGGITHTVWNVLHGFDPRYGIKDYDLVYYDASDISYEGEDIFIQKGKEAFEDIPVLIEIRNQARVHLWYEKHFGYSINQSKSVENSIRTWPTMATCVGVRNVSGQLQVYAPYGLDDLFNMVVRPNKVKITKEIYRTKLNRWTKIWPKLKIIPWKQE